MDNLEIKWPMETKQDIKNDGDNWMGFSSKKTQLLIINKDNVKQKIHNIC